MENTSIKSSTDKRKVFIWGASGHALFIMNIISLRRDIELVGLIDDINIQNNGALFNGFPVLGGKDVLSQLKAQGVTGSVLGFGNCSARLRLGTFLQNEGFELVSLIHPNSSIARSASIGAGVVIGSAVVVDANCVIEDNCILNNSCSVSHGTLIGTGTHIGPGVVIGGDVTIGNSCCVEIGSTVIRKISIGSKAFIDAGSLVTENVPDGVLSCGVPARVVREIDYEF